MEFLIITGLSGAGKSRAADVLEDIEYYCVDNMPVALIPKFAEFCIAAGGKYEKVALVTDVREGSSFEELLQALDILEKNGCRCHILYMDADTRTLIRRYKESRRPHPLAEPGLSIEDAVRRETELLAPVRERADYIINSSSLTLGMLQNRIYSIFLGNTRKRELDVTIMSFGYKFGLPMEADLVLDARFLPNPFYIDELRRLSGLDAPVAEYVFSHSQSRDFLTRIEGLIDYLLPFYLEEGKYCLTVAIGCTGGRHRSVALAAALTEHLRANGTPAANVNRDIDRQL